MSFVILGSHGFVAQSLKSFLVSKKKKFLAVGKNQIDFLKENSSLRLKKILNKNKNCTMVITSSIAPAKNLDDYLSNIKIIGNIIKGINVNPLPPAGGHTLWFNRRRASGKRKVLGN